MVARFHNPPHTLTENSEILMSIAAGGTSARIVVAAISDKVDELLSRDSWYYTFIFANLRYLLAGKSAD